MVFQEEQLRERILKLIHHEDFTQKKFAEKINRQPSNLNAILAGERGVPKGLTTDILNAFPDINKDWLIFGEGEMYQKGKQKEPVVLPKNTKPRLPRTLSEGHLQDYFEGVKRPLCEELPIDTRMPEYDFSLFLKTDRMAPNYRRGDELFFKRTAIKEWGGCYLLDTAEGPKFKKVYEDTDEKGNPVYRCVAYDRVQYPDFMIPKDMVYGFYKCVGSLRIS